MWSIIQSTAIKVFANRAKYFEVINYIRFSDLLMDVAATIAHLQGIESTQTRQPRARSTRKRRTQSWMLVCQQLMYLFSSMNEPQEAVYHTTRRYHPQLWANMKLSKYYKRSIYDILSSLCDASSIGRVWAPQNNKSDQRRAGLSVENCQVTSLVNKHQLPMISLKNNRF